MELHFPLMGASFRPSEARETVRGLQAGDELTLEPDTNNKYDAFAVRVLYDGEHIGYLPKGHNTIVFEALCNHEDVSCSVFYSDNNLKPELLVRL